MSPRAKIQADPSTESKLKEAARRLFTRNGYAAVKTRDIAKEAGMNIALLNYYFRSKEKLFEIIMMENMGHFFQGISAIVNDEKTSFHKKIELLVDFYISRLIANPDLPMFVLNVARNNPKKLPIQFRLADSYFMKQLMWEAEAGRIKKINPGHLIMNILGLTIFPFIARPIMQSVRGLSNKEYESFMLERKKLVPEWIKSMLEIKK